MSGQACDLAAVTQVVLRERQARDRGWWDAMAACFAADAVIDMSWFRGPAAEFIARTRERSTGGVWGRHRLGPPTAHVVDDRAWVELPVGIEFDLDLDGGRAVLVSYCRSQYRLVRAAGTGYACLAWYLDRLGTPLPDDLPGGRPTRRRVPGVRR